jgi:YD repeat-containing protein
MKGAEKMSYMTRGWLKDVAYPSGKQLSYSYDIEGRLLSQDLNGEERIMSEYDTFGRLSVLTGDLGSEKYLYDNQNRITKTDYSEGYSVGYTYDLFGNVSSISYPDGSQVTYQFDDLDRMVSMTTALGKTEYSYNGNGRLLKETRPGGGSVTRTYDEAGRMLSMKNESGPSLISSYEYSYDSLSRIISERITDEGGLTSRTYAYQGDELRRYSETVGGSTT